MTESIIQDRLDAKIDTLKADACVPNCANELVHVIDVDGARLAIKRRRAST